MNSGIYGIQNTVNGKWYIGQSVRIQFRKRCHFSYLRRGIHYNAHLQRAFTKDGESSFVFVILEIVPEHLLDDRERFWISKHNSLSDSRGYNIEDGGSLRKHHSEATKKKLSLKRIGMKMPESAKQKLREMFTGRKWSDAQRRTYEKRKELGVYKESIKRVAAFNKVHQAERLRKLARSHVGKSWGHHTPETLQVLSERRQGTRASPETREKMRRSHPDHWSEKRRKLGNTEKNIAQLKRLHEGRIGSHHTPETIAKMRLAQRLRFQKEKAVAEQQTEFVYANTSTLSA